MSHPPSLARSLPPSLPSSTLQHGVAHIRNLHVPHRDPLLLLLYFGDNLALPLPPSYLRAARLRPLPYFSLFENDLLPTAQTSYT